MNKKTHSRGDRHLGYSSRHTQVPVSATIESTKHRIENEKAKSNSYGVMPECVGCSSTTSILCR